MQNPKSSIPTRREFSAGGVVYRQNGGHRFEVALIATHQRERWGLPKGWIEEGEPPKDAAVREVREETGLTARLIDLLDTIEYWFRWPREGNPVRIHKTVYFYLMEATGGSLEDHDHEVDEARWFPLDEAVEAASYSGERQVLIKAREKIISPTGPRPVGETERGDPEPR